MKSNLTDTGRHANSDVNFYVEYFAQKEKLTEVEGNMVLITREGKETRFMQKLTNSVSALQLRRCKLQERVQDQYHYHDDATTILTHKISADLYLDI